jgi:hypothetical protein
MDEFDFKEEKTGQPKFKFGSAVLNLGSLIALISTLCAGGYFIQIFLDPQSSLNPLPPATTAVAELPTATLELLFTDTPIQTPTATLEPPTATPTPEPVVSFDIQDGSPAALDSSVFHPELACNFIGVTGQVFGLDDAPITGLQIHVTGTLNGEAVDKIGLTGAATQYGPGAYYEIQLGNTPVASDNTLQIVLLNEQGLSVSTATAFTTYANCQQNLILINFKALP